MTRLLYSLIRNSRSGWLDFDLTDFYNLLSAASHCANTLIYFAFDRMGMLGSGVRYALSGLCRLLVSFAHRVSRCCNGLECIFCRHTNFIYCALNCRVMTCWIASRCANKACSGAKTYNSYE